jgi:Flp pilus assembly pilin Flp
MKANYDVFSTWLTLRIRSERGAIMVEYALLISLVVIVAIGAIRLYGSTVQGNYSEINSTIEDNLNGP